MNNISTKELKELAKELSTEETETNIFQYMELSKKERTAHLNLSDDCIPAILSQNSSRRNAGEFMGAEYARLEASDILSEFLNVDGKKDAGRYVHTCHACMNDSTAPSGFVCVNPKHMYFGTPKENNEDRPYWNKRKGGLASWSNLTPQQRQDRRKKLSKSVKNFYYNTEEGKKVREKQSKGSTENMLNQLANGNHITQKVHTCDHCGKSAKGRIFFRWHGDNCKKNPANSPEAKEAKLND